MNTFIVRAAEGAQKSLRNWEGEKCLFFQNTFILDMWFYCQPFPNPCFCCLFSDACCACCLQNRCHWAELERQTDDERHTHTHVKQTLILHIHRNLPITLCIMAYLICGNWGSSDEGRDGGLCNHAVGGNAVRRGVEPEKGRRLKAKPGESEGNGVKRREKW